MSVRFTTPRPIAAADDLDEFDCGEPNLNDWLRKRAWTNPTTGATRTFVTTRAGKDRVVGYYALAAAGVKKADVPSGIGKGQPSMIPVILLARLGVIRTTKVLD